MNYTEKFFAGSYFEIPTSFLGSNSYACSCCQESQFFPWNNSGQKREIPMYDWSNYHLEYFRATALSHHELAASLDIIC